MGRRFFIFFLLSLAIHILALGSFVIFNGDNKVTKALPQRVTIRERVRPRSVTVAAPVVAEKPKIKSKKKKVTTKAKPKIAPQVPVVPVLKPNAPAQEPVEELPQTESTNDVEGVGDASSTNATSGEGVSLEHEASLIQESMEKIEYTRDALKAGLQGRFDVDIHLDARGHFIEAEMVQDPGFGMTELILHALQNANYIPKTDAQGKGLETWFTTTVKLDLR